MRSPIPSPSRKIGHAATALVTETVAPVAMVIIAVSVETAIIAVPVTMVITVVPVATVNTVVAVLQIRGPAIMAKAVTQVAAAGAATKVIPGITPVGIMVVGNMTGITVMRIAATGIAVMSSPTRADEDRAVTADSTAAMVTMAAGSIRDTMVMSSLIAVDADMVVAVDTNTVTTPADVITVTMVTSTLAMADTDVIMATTPMENTTATVVLSLLIGADEDTKVAAGTVITLADDITVIAVTNSLAMADMDIIMVTTLTDDTTVIITGIADMSSLIAADADTAVTDTATMLAAGTTGIVGTSSLIAAPASIMVTTREDNITDITVMNSPTAAGLDLGRITLDTTATGLLTTAVGDAAVAELVI